MALNIDGTTGISGVDGSASAASIAGTDANTGLSFASDTVNINTGGVTRATIGSSGKVLIGTTTAGGGSAMDVTVANSGTAGITIRSGSSSNGNVYFADGTSGTAEYAGYIEYGHTNNHLAFATNAAERMRIDSGGRVQIGTTSAIQNSLLSLVSGNGVRVIATESGGTSTNDAILFRNPNGDIGRITTSGSSTAYNTSSDYRLKENVVAISDGITRLKTLKPYRFNFKADASTTLDGFFAHEVTAVPEAIIGTKDEIDADKNPVHQGIDQSKLVPLLTAALQEAVAKIEVLETKVAALEAG